MTENELMHCVESAVEQGYHTVVLQSGEDEKSAETIARTIAQIKKDYTVAVTLSLGERSHEDYRLWKQAGADCYLLRIESTDADP
ncbi:MAG: hypothetical protein VB127_09265 [Sphaerochaeta sp.]|nr:hypothetical protein [Sphaerochaeta sp.]